jgi:alkylation response protein AidB-like acyl-CoA dehydrogenase
MDTEINIGRAFVDQCIAEYKARGLDNRRTAMAKLWCSEMAGRVIDSCVQLHGGAGYMSDYWISKIYTATRIRRIFGGTSEIMKRLIAKGM